MEYGSLEKEIHIAAPPAVVYEVISSPAHIRQWWTDEADFDPAPGGTGVLVWADRATSKTSVVQLTVIDAVPAERFVFRWDYPQAEIPTPRNSLLVTFQLIPDGAGTLLKVTEEGFRERGWEAAVLEDYYQRHDDGWSRHLAHLASYIGELVAR